MVCRLDFNTKAAALNMKRHWSLIIYQTIIVQNAQLYVIINNKNDEKRY